MMLKRAAGRYAATSLKKYIFFALVLMSVSGSLFLHFGRPTEIPLTQERLLKKQITNNAQIVDNESLKLDVKEQNLVHSSKNSAIRVLHVALEYEGAEVGGIAAVTKTMIPKLNMSAVKTGVNATLIMPKYSFLSFDKSELKEVACVIHFFRKNWVKSCVYEANDSLLLVDSFDNNLREIYHIEDKNGIYTDDRYFAPVERWMHFNSAVAAFVSEYKDPISNQPFHILHAHSYHAGVAIELLNFYKSAQEKNGLQPPKTILHMHGLSYDQGWIKGELLESVGLNSAEQWENLTKRILAKVDFVVMVSQNMMKDALSQTGGSDFGLRPSLLNLYEKDRIKPILNGINAKQWDPTSVLVLPDRNGQSYIFTENDIPSGKRNIKTLLMEQGYFSSNDRPLVTFVGRFSDEKGIEHLHAAVSEVIRLGGNFAVLGSYGKSYNSRQMIERLIVLSKTEPFLGRLLILDSVEVQKNNSLGNYMRAASDFSFVPSKEETCGLVPLEFFGFGAMTITSYVGGLRDTVIPYLPNREFFNGFVFRYDDSDDLYWSIRQAFEFIQNNKEQFRRIQKKILKEAARFDWSTENGAVTKLVSLYQNAVSL